MAAFDSHPSSSMNLLYSAGLRCSSIWHPGHAIALHSPALWQALHLSGSHRYITEQKMRCFTQKCCFGRVGLRRQLQVLVRKGKSSNLLGSNFYLITFPRFLVLIQSPACPTRCERCQECYGTPAFFPQHLRGWPTSQACPKARQGSPKARGSPKQTAGCGQMCGHVLQNTLIQCMLSIHCLKHWTLCTPHTAQSQVQG